MHINFRGLGLTNFRRTKFEILAILLCIITPFILYYFSDRLGPTINEFPELFQQLAKLKSYYSTHKLPYHRALNISAEDRFSIGLSPQLEKRKKRNILDDSIAVGERRLSEIINYNIDSPNYPKQSQYTDIKALTEYGWQQSQFRVQAPDPDSEYGIVFTALGLSLDMADWVVANDMHSSVYYMPSSTTVSHLPTRAHYTSLFDPNQACIISINTLSPRETLWYSRLHHSAPPLEKLSDNLFLNWIRIIGSDRDRVAGLKHYLLSQISDPASIKVIDTLEHASKNIVAWPGTDFLIPNPLSPTELDDGGRVLLGTSASAPIADLLLEHKAYFPRKYISKITVFKTDENLFVNNNDQLDHRVPKYNMLFYIDDLPPSAASQHSSPPGSPPPSPPGRSRWKCCFKGW